MNLSRYDCMHILYCFLWQFSCIHIRGTCTLKKQASSHLRHAQKLCNSPYSTQPFPLSIADSSLWPTGCQNTRWLQALFPLQIRMEEHCNSEFWRTRSFLFVSLGMRPKCSMINAKVLLREILESIGERYCCDQSVKPEEQRIQHTKIQMYRDKKHRVYIILTMHVRQDPYRPASTEAKSICRSYVKIHIFMYIICLFLRSLHPSLTNVAGLTELLLVLA